MSDNLNNQPWRRWMPDDFAAPTVPPAVETDEGEIDAASDATNALPQPVDELQRMRDQVQQQAQRDGFNQGKQQGYDAGYQAGLDAGSEQGLLDAKQQQQPLIEQLQQMVGEFQHTLDALDSVIPARLMQLALTAAKQILGQPPVCDGSALLSQIQQLMQQEPLFNGKPQLRVNPSDLERVEQVLGATLDQHGWRLLADNQLHPGGCKITAEDGDLDASLATRWHELCRLAAPGDL
ncbi:flagellar assembly protein FliH [Brenneria goodwinii]|uniref:Flagellar assembly protein FliH n=1 Tax=Brenneria goodwinii TaxID=1109412 RepID=A0A0G4K210_9GAMM|nr:flagellar assembly protein FliH [Brenneria goodwinii]MCG8158135.1 flagellar assembly protein FliH [Brenneria goodwinii]MCG8162476.1 flagellar assembly protein FliH [Brenneria goodwinii]MCG8167186.1 flagellar assembly protein FliH [Brenneria goodwinii]MCG8171846.1 flagellar assembly protein FliH [Brenneria goodwinii]MCG8176522.1 flagellar assembly protein FliH [Brenneria goodwinii]